MIEGGWAYVWAAYAAAVGALLALSVIVALRFVHWSRRARALEEKQSA